jgi:hypothetical protein
MLFVAWVYDQIFHCCRRIKKTLFKDEEDDSVHLSDLPWLWLGFVGEEGNILDYTNTIKFNHEPNIHVTPEFLTNVADLSVEGKWQYMDQTLQIHDFPSEGFVINHVVDETGNEKKTD